MNNYFRFLLLLLSVSIIESDCLSQPTFPPATQAEVDAGIIRTKFVSPATLAGFIPGGSATNAQPPSSSLSNLAASGFFTLSNANLLFVDVGGTNATAKKGRRDLPYRDPVAAKNAAVAGDTVVVFPGIYTTNSLLKNGVNWYGYPGAVLNFIDNGTGAGRGIFDDRDSGSCTSTIWGAFDIRYSTGLTGYNVGLNTITPNPTNVANLRGAICITNALSKVTLNCSSIAVTSLVNVGTIAGVYVQNCTEVHVNCPRIVDPIYTNTFYIGDDDAATPVFGSSTMAGVWWRAGPTYITADEIRVASQAIYAVEPAGTTVTNNLWVTAAHIENNQSQHLIYLVGLTPYYKVWIDAKDIIANNSGGSGGLGFYGEGRYYIKAEKIAAAGNAIVSAAGSQVAWVTSHKIASASKWCNVQGGTLYVECPSYEDVSGITQGWDVSDGELIVFGGVAQVLNGTGLRVTGTGKARFKNVSIDCSPGNLMTNTPVFVSTNGVILNSCVLVAPTAAPSLMAVSAKSVLSYNSITANKTNHPLVSVLVGPFTVDSNVR
jgi:hypothetical protein